MKALSLLIAVMPFIFANEAAAVNWTPVATNEGLSMNIDTDTVVTLKNGDKKVWVEYVHNEEQTANNGVKYVRAVELKIFRCPDRTVSNAQQILHNSIGNVVGSVAIPKSQMSFYEIAPGTLNEATLEFVCKKAAKRK